MANMYGIGGAMMGPGGLISDSGFSDWAGGYSERSSKRPRLTEPNYYFSVSGNNPLRGTEEAYDMPPAANRSEQVRIFGSNLNVMGSTFYRPSHAGGILGGESTSGLHNFPVVRLRGLPFDCQDRDIYSFFVGLDVVDCLCVNKNGRFTGEAYVVFPNRMQVQLSLQWDHQNMGHRYVEVFLCKKRDYYNAVASEVKSCGYISGRKWSPPPAPRNKRSLEEPKEEFDLNGVRFTDVLKLRGLPYSVTRAEIVEFFGEEFDLKETDIGICCRYDGKATGEAFAKFSCSEVAKKAMKRDKMTIGSRYVELFPSTAKEARRGNCWK